MISITINGQTLDAPAGSTVLEVAERAGIVIPTLCHHKDLSPFGGCRLCVVEVQSNRLPCTACNLPVSQGMVVRTESPALTQDRRTTLELLLRNYYDAGYKRSNGHFDLETDTQFAHWVKVYGIDMQTAMAKGPRYPIDSDPNPFIWVDLNKCIFCTRCIRACAEIQGRFVWNQGARGYQARIVAGNDTTMLQARCESCGACVVYCPTGALDNKMSINLGRPDRWVPTTCSYCSVGCQFNLNVKNEGPNGRVIRVTSSQVAPVNGLHLCVKGRYGYDFIHNPDRLLKPCVRQYLLDGRPRPKTRGPFVEVDWDVALNLVAARLVAARSEGPDRIGLLTSGKVLNEENYLMNKLARQVLGTNNIDCSAYLHTSSTTAGLDASIGVSAMTNSMDDIACHARSMFIIGSNVTEQHPVFGAKIRQAVLRRGTRLVVANPLFTNIDEYATLAMRYNPGTEAALLNGLMHIILEHGWENKEFIQDCTDGFDEFRKVIGQYPPLRVEQITAIPATTLYKAAQTLVENAPMAVIWGIGVTDLTHGPQIVKDLANLQMLLGNLGVPGGGVAPLQCQNNTQGASDMGGLPNYYPGYQPVMDRAVRNKFEMTWGAELSARAGMPAMEMISAAGKGALKALFVLGEDLISDEGDLFIRRSLEASDFIVLETILPTQTANYADVLLPGVSFAEKTGTFTNTERRIQMVHQAIEPLGRSRPDWQILSELANRILMYGGRTIAEYAYASWEYANTSQIMDEIAALTPIYAGVSHKRLERGESLLWPVESPHHLGTPILHVGDFHGGKGWFIPIEYISDNGGGL